MAHIGILTDSSAHFPQPKFPGQDTISIIDFKVSLGDRIIADGREAKSFNFPPSLVNCPPEKAPHLIAPSVETFAQHIERLRQRYQNLLLILQSAYLSAAYENALQAASLLQCGANIAVINAQTISTGLGLLVQSAAGQVAQGVAFNKLEASIRHNIPKVYTLLCTPALSYLSHNGFITYPQAIVGEMLGVLQVFSLEEDRLAPLEKVRNYRHSIELFMEFLEEFERLNHVALIQSAPPLTETHLLRQFVAETFPGTTFTEHKANLPMTALFGPRFLGLIALESIEP